MMIDYNATLQAYFAECIKFLEKRAKRAKGDVELNQINDAIAIVKNTAKKPTKYADYGVRLKYGLIFGELPSDLWQSGVLHKYERVLKVVENLDCPYEYDRAAARDVLLESLKDIKCKNNKNVFKDLYYSLSLPTKFAVKVKQNQR